MRKEFELTQEQFDTILSACQSVPAIMLQCGPTRSAQENANDAWKALGRELGFDGMTVKPVPGKSQLFLTADVVEEPA